MKKTNVAVVGVASAVTSIEVMAVFFASSVLDTIDVYFIESLLVMLFPLFLLNCFLVTKTSVYDVAFKKSDKTEEKNSSKSKRIIFGKASLIPA